MYTPVPREQIADTLIHLRGLFRGIPPSSEKDYRAHERREILTKTLLSNLVRTKDHPTLRAVLEVADAFSLTLDGTHRLFGYELENIFGRLKTFRYKSWCTALLWTPQHIACMPPSRRRMVNQ